MADEKEVPSTTADGRLIVIDGEELELKEPRGRNGRRATNYLIAFASGKEESSIEELLGLTVDEEFLDNHMKAFFSKEDAKFVDEHATTGELLNMVMKVITSVFDSFQTPEMDAALKNLPEAQEEEGE